MSDRSVKYRPIVINKATVDVIMASLKENDTVSVIEALGLYTFYYYTSVWQETPIAKATVGYTAKGLGISEVRIRRIKKVLVNCGLIEDVTRRDALNKIVGHYIRVNFCAKEETVIKAVAQQEMAINHTVEEPPYDKTHSVALEHPNACINGIGNAYRDNKLNACKDNISCATDTNFDAFWECYPRKVAKGDARKAWKALKPSEELAFQIIESVKHQAQSLESWQKDNGKFIPYPATWLRAERWNDEIVDEPKDDEDEQGGFALSEEEIAEVLWGNLSPAQLAKEKAKEMKRREAKEQARLLKAMNR